MKDQPANPMLNPSKKQLIICTAVWFIGLSLLVLVMTDLFTTSPFRSKYIMLYLLMAGSTLTVGWQHINFFRNRKHSVDSGTKG